MTTAHNGGRAMRIVWAALFGSILASCGSDEPASVDFDRPLTAVYSALATVDGQVSMEGLIRSPVVARRQESDDLLVFALGPDSARHRGEVTFRFSKMDENRTRVSVDAEIPEIKAAADGQARVLSESRIEAVLTERLQLLAQRLREGKAPGEALDRIDQAIAFAALALDPSEVNRALELARNDAALSAAIEHEADWGRHGVSDEAWREEAPGYDATSEEPTGEEPEPFTDFDG